MDFQTQYLQDYQQKMNRDGSFTSSFNNQIQCVECSQLIKDPTHKCIGFKDNIYTGMNYRHLVNMNVLRNIENITIVDYINDKIVEIDENLDFYELLVKHRIIYAEIEEESDFYETDFEEDEESEESE
jgi:hypothetical protein